MAIYEINDRFIFVTASERPTDYPSGTLLYDNISLLYYQWNGTVWNLIGFAAEPTAEKTAAYTLTDYDKNIMANATTAGFTLTLPTAIGRANKVYKIKKTDITSNVVVIDASGTETIDGLLTWDLRFAEDYIEIVSDGANWKTLDYSTFDINAYKRRGSTENRWYIAGRIENTALSSIAITANILYANPIIISKPLSLSDLAINVTTGVAATNAKLAIYKDNGNLIPASLVYDAGAIATATNSTFASIAVSPSPIKLQPGLYWLAVVSDGGATIRFIPVASQLPILGNDNVATTSYGGPGYYKGFTYPAGAMPDPFPTALTVNAAAQIPAIYARFV